MSIKIGPLPSGSPRNPEARRPWKRPHHPVAVPQRKQRRSAFRSGSILFSVLLDHSPIGALEGEFTRRSRSYQRAAVGAVNMAQLSSFAPFESRAWRFVGLLTTVATLDGVLVRVRPKWAGHRHDPVHRALLHSSTRSPGSPVHFSAFADDQRL